MLNDCDAVHTEDTVCPQNIGVEFEFLLLKAIQELKTEIDVLKQVVALLKQENISKTM